MTTLKYKIPNEVLIAGCGLLIAGVGLGSLTTLLMQRAVPIGPMQHSVPSNAIVSKTAPAEISPATTPSTAKPAIAAPGATANAAAAPLHQQPAAPPPGTAAKQPKPATVTPAVRTASPLPAIAPSKSAETHKSLLPPLPPLPPTTTQLAAQEPVPSRPSAASPAETPPIPQGPQEQYVTMAAAGIEALEPTSVRFASGRIVTVGSTFPSGEKLLFVDASRGRIVTDKRVLVVSASQRPSD